MACQIASGEFSLTIAAVSCNVPTQVHFSLLEVGALKPDNYASCSSWIDVTPIDLRSRHPAIREQDFLGMAVDENQGKWDIISLSLVVNFVPEPRNRGACSLTWRPQVLEVVHST